MKKALLVSFCLLFVLTSLVMARPATKGTSPADYNIQIYNDQNDLPLDRLFSAAQADTYLLAQYEFDSGGQCVTDGWQGVDLTAQAGVLFHVDTYRPINGAQSMWCGHRASTLEPWCGYVALPGYGNNWNQFLTSKAWATTGDVTVAFNARYDSEGGYDFTYFEYVDTSTIAETWITAETYDGAYDSVVSVTIPAAELPGTIKVRWHFSADGAWSDEDGLWNTQGAFIVDDIVISDGSGVIESENWEDEAVGATHSNEPGPVYDWTATEGAGYGDFSGLFAGVAVLQEDICTEDLTCLWGMFNGSTDDYSCATPTPHPEQKVVPYENDRGQFIIDEIWSPWIDLTGVEQGNPVPATASSATLEFYDYRNRPLDNLIFMVWHVRTKLGTTGCPGGWVDRNFVYYGPGPDWLRILQPVGDILTPGDNYVQLALGVQDMCPYWCGYYGTGDCHSHSPLFDHVKFYRINTVGAIFSVRDIDLFQDNFPEDGTLTGTVRIDAAIDRMPATSLNIYPGDSLVFTTSEPNFGLGTAADGRAAVYCYVKSTGGGTPAAWEASEVGMYTAKRYPYIAGPTGGGFYQFQCDSSYQDVAMTNPTPDKFCFDLNDDYFTPPARIDFYFSAVDGAANTIYWTQAGHTLVQTEAEDNAMEMQCLPTGDSDILYVDNFSGRGGQVYFDTAFELLGVNPDRYDKRGPSSLVANGLGARAAIAQVVDVYHKILYNCGDLGGGNIGDGSGNPEKSADAQLLYTFLDQTTVWNPGVYISGDDVANEMKTLNTAPFTDLFNFINYNVVSGNHVAAGYAIAPLVIGSTVGNEAAGYIFQHTGPPAVGDTMVAFGGCPLVNDFDVLEATGASVEAMYYNGGGEGAVLTQQTVNAQGKTAKVVLSGFSYHYIRDDRPTYPFDRLDHIDHIIRWFENITDMSTGAGDTPIVNSLAQNYPNPFNPTTTIEFSIKDRAHVSLKVYNVAGQLVKTLEDNVLRAGVYTNYQWDGLDNNNQPVASGVYFYKLVSKNFSQTRKMVLLK